MQPTPGVLEILFDIFALRRKVSKSREATQGSDSGFRVPKSTQSVGVPGSVPGMLYGTRNSGSRARSRSAFRRNSPCAAHWPSTACTTCPFMRKHYPNAVGEAVPSMGTVLTEAQNDEVDEIEVMESVEIGI